MLFAVRFNCASARASTRDIFKTSDKVTSFVVLRGRFLRQQRDYSKREKAASSPLKNPQKTSIFELGLITNEV